MIKIAHNKMHNKKRDIIMMMEQRKSDRELDVMDQQFQSNFIKTIMMVMMVNSGKAR